MRGDAVFRVYGVHDGRVDDRSSGTFRTRAAAEAEIEDLLGREVGDENWARRYRNGGFVIRDHVVATDFEIPPRPSPRDSYVVSISPKPNETGWDSTIVEVRRRSDHGEPEPVCSYERDHAMFQTFEPFRQGDRDLALISRHYTETAVLDIASGEVIAEEDPGGGFCPVGFYVPDWWDVHDGRTIPGSDYWGDDNEWPTGDFGFVWGCHWGDDSGWKVQYLDLSRVQDGVITRDARFGYTKLATADYLSPCFLLDRQEGERVRRPPFIDISAYSGRTRVTMSTEVDFELDSGATLPEELDYDRATGELIARDD